MSLIDHSWREEPPTDKEIADHSIIAWQFIPRTTKPYRNSPREHCGHDNKPRLLQVMFIGPGEPRAWEPGVAKTYYFRPFMNVDGILADPEAEWELEGFWKPVFISSTM